jgi:stage III sporulation protein AG
VFQLGEYDWRRLLQKFQDSPGSFWFLLGLLGLGLLFLLGGDRKERQSQSQNLPLPAQVAATPQTTEAATKLERELTAILSRIAGVGKVRVAISLKTANRRLWERQTKVTKRVVQKQGELDSEESSSDELVFAKDREGTDNPVLQAELAPEVQGVLVVAEGAGDSAIKRLLTETMMTILDLPAHRVMVIAGEGSGNETGTAMGDFAQD